MSYNIEILAYLSLNNDIIEIINNYISSKCSKCNKEIEVLEENTKFCINCNLVYIEGHCAYDLYNEDLIELDYNYEY